MAFGDTAQAGAQIGSLAGGGAAGPIGAAIGMGIDLFGLFAQRSAAEDEAERFSAQQLRGQAVEINSLQARRLQEQLSAAQTLEDLERSGQLALSAANQSALESGVAGNSVKALSNAKRMQVDRVKERIRQRQDQLDANFQIQASASALRTKTSINQAVLSLENGLPSIFDILGGGLGTAGTLAAG